MVWPKTKKEGWREGFGIGWWEGGVLHFLPGSWPLRGVHSMLRRACQVGLWWLPPGSLLGLPQCTGVWTSSLHGRERVMVPAVLGVEGSRVVTLHPEGVTRQDRWGQGMEDEGVSRGRPCGWGHSLFSPFLP